MFLIVGLLSEVLDLLRLLAALFLKFLNNLLELLNFPSLVLLEHQLFLSLVQGFKLLTFGFALLLKLQLLLAVLYENLLLS